MEADSAAEVDGFVSSYPPEMREVIEKLRRVASASLTGMQEILYHGAIGYSPTGLPSDRIVYILPAKKHVTLGFFFGSHLPDPERLLTGEGKRMRHVKVMTAAEATAGL
ncbi:MAG TPA: DUF1801 domain-containing protein [Nitrososphaerales archaeon]|nr:DUF1801 domain-containing protein [Nitrososphaerales archaeon]